MMMMIPSTIRCLKSHGGHFVNSRSLSSNVKIMPNRPEIGILTLDSAPVNSLTKDLFLKITAGIKELESDSVCETVLLTSSCRVFSAGLDLKCLYGSSRSELADYWFAFQDTQRALYNSRLLTVAAMNGHSMAGGCILALCCDERVLASSAKIGLNEASFGIVAPPFSAVLMTQVIGNRLAERALNLGTVFSSAQALNIGLIDDVYTPSTTPADPSTGDPFLNHCADYAARLLTVPSATKIGVPGRVASKQRLRKPLDDSFYGTAAFRQKDVDVFVDMVSDSATQTILGNYLQQLSGAGKTKK